MKLFIHSLHVLTERLQQNPLHVTKTAFNLSAVLQQYHEDGARIEAAFRRYIHRADPKQKEDSYEIIVCHANVIRYFVCRFVPAEAQLRALQFPPEGWLRMGLHNGSITWLTIRPSGRVGLRTMGDAGFMPPDKLTRT
uniref:Serine/threonine-protein phosphatase PGAM5, mitochondrial n=1 Tax=Nothobranchius pienaari TaxID=704102 RepID=A0A1A8QQ81_9TELE